MLRLRQSRARAVDGHERNPNIPFTNPLRRLPSLRAPSWWRAFQNGPPLNLPTHFILVHRGARAVARMSVSRVLAVLIASMLPVAMAMAQDGSAPKPASGSSPQPATPAAAPAKPVTGVPPKTEVKPKAPAKPAPVPNAAPAAKPVAADPKAGGGVEPAAAPKIEETRLTLSKWIETQQIISKERNDWQQGKEILQGRIDLVGKEVSQLKDRIAQSEAAVVESQKKRDDLTAQNTQLKEVGAQLATTVTQMEAQVQKLAKLAPEGVATKLLPLLQRIPADANTTRVSVAERFQNVLGILNELNKANSEITIAYEIRQLADGSSSEVQVIYVGLAQAYYLSPRGEAGIGKPTENGWVWRPASDQAGAIFTALEIIQGKHPPEFVGLPISIQ